MPLQVHIRTVPSISAARSSAEGPYPRSSCSISLIPTVRSRRLVPLSANTEFTTVMTWWMRVSGNPP